jgi:hypothetical protein
MFKIGDKVVEKYGTRKGEITKITRAESRSFVGFGISNVYTLIVEGENFPFVLTTGVLKSLWRKMK